MLKFRSAVCFTLLLLCQCARRDLRTSIENDTGQNLWIVIETEETRAVRRAVPAEKILSVPQPIEKVTKLTYAAGKLHCELTKDQIRRAVDGTLFGRPLIKLRPC